MPADADHVDRFRVHAGLIMWDETEVARCSIEPGLARILDVAARLEEDTAITVRQGSSLGLDRSTDLAQFLPQWDIEEAEHGRALRALLDHQRYEPLERIPPSIAVRRRVVARLPARAFAHLPQTAFLFCVLGAAAEYVATVLYAELAKHSGARPVEDLLRSIARQEARHFSFFLSAARLRGDHMTSLNGRLARRVLHTIWEPIGVPTLGLPAWYRMFEGWLADEHFRTRLEMMDRVVDSIPHLEGSRLMGRFLADLTTP